MSPRKARVVTACQQLLALGAVLAVLTPAAAIVSLDVVGQGPATSRQAAPPSVAPPPQTQRREHPRPAPSQQRQQGQQGTHAQPVADPAPSVPPSTATVPTTPVEATVTEVALTSDTGAATGHDRRQGGSGDESTPEAPDAPEAEQEQAPEEAPEQTPGQAPGKRQGPEGEAYSAEEPLTRVVSEPQPVETFGTVGVTWSSGQTLHEEDITLEVRARTGDAWSGWEPLEYHDEHAPDPDSQEALSSRPGTEPVVLGEVDAVQVSATAPEGLPSDMSLAVVEPGEAEGTETEGPAIAVSPEGAATTDAQASAAGAWTGDSQDRDSQDGDTQDGDSQDGDTQGAIALRADVKAPKPTIYSRSQWGADERLRSGSPSYGSIGAGFVHHTVNGNDYTRAEVPGILRSIYAYHTRSRGWSDIGYNFLVDKFGRIWEGRYGGVARPVIGAHTLGYNDDAFAMSAIGNFETARPTEKMLQSYGALFAWKLGLHGVRADDMSQSLDGDKFAAINGHRDAGSTACPGRYLYNKLGAIRTLAQAAQDADTTTPEPEEPEPDPEPTLRTVTPTRPDSDLAGTAYPDLVVRRASDARGLVLPTGGLTRFTRATTIAAKGWGTRSVVTTPDLTGDGRVDLLVVRRGGRLEVRPGLGGGDFGAPERVVRSFRGHAMPVGVGDVNDNSRNDLVGVRDGRLVTFMRGKRGGFRAVQRDTDVRGFTQLTAAGDVTSDGIVDLWGRDGQGRLALIRGTGRGRFAAPAAVAGDWSGYRWFAGGVDHTGDGRPDLLARRGNALVVLQSRGDGTLAPALGPVRAAKNLTKPVGTAQFTGASTADLLTVTDAGALVVVPSRGTFDVGSPIDTGQSFKGGNLLINAGDFDGDGRGDVLMRRRRGPVVLFRGNGAGRLAAPVRIGGRWFRRYDDLRVTGDVTGDKRPDLIGVRRADGVTRVWPGNGAKKVSAAFEAEVVDESTTASFDAGSYDWRISISDLRRKGPSDLVVRSAENGWLYRVNGTRKGTRGPRYLGELRGYDLGG